LKGDGKGVGVGEVEPTIKVINATRTVWNFQTPAWNYYYYCYYYYYYFFNTLGSKDPEG